MDASCCPDLKATPAEILPWVVMRWSVAVTFDEARAPLGVEPQRQGPAKALVRTTPVLLGLVALVTLLALRLRQTAPLPVAATAWSHTVEPTVAACHAGMCVDLLAIPSLVLLGALIDWHLLDEARVGPEAAITPKRGFSFERLNARKQILITLSDPKRLPPRHPHSSSLFFSSRVSSPTSFFSRAFSCARRASVRAC
jgi:hypothetical protein